MCLTLFKPILKYSLHNSMHVSLPVIAAILVILPLLVGCAKIAEPQPPEIRIPKAAVDLSGHQRADSVVLQATLPRQNTTGSPVTTLQRVEVYRLAENPSMATNLKQIPSEQFEQDADPILSIAESRFPDLTKENYLIFEDNLPNMEPSFKYMNAFRYALLFVNDKNQAAGFSNQFVIAPVAIPLPPEGINTKVYEDFIHLRWVEPSENMDGSKPPRISGYNMYRSENPESMSSKPLNSEPLQKPEFKDVHFQFDNTYYYRIRVIGSLGDPLAESALSKGTSVTPRDIFPPQPVGNFNVISDNDAALLLWQPSSSTDIAGYRIARTEKETGAIKQLQTELITAYSYSDGTILSGRTYTYTIESIDRHGNESSSVTSEITIP